ncbi:hypothetical protein MKW92_001267 [Papaver armeniacum]|nr:hypothetical protein MKW92_001267 [Papaver armeniacum]
MLERALSMRGRTTQTTEEEGIGGGGGGNEEERDDDESKTRKISLAMRITNLITYKFGVYWPCSFIIFSFLLLVSSLIIRSRNSVCVSSLGFKKQSKSGRTVEWTTKDLLKGLEEFVPIYETHPIKNNQYGMGFDHSFGLWFMTRWLKPDLMMESGAFKGHSTWVLRQAMPDTPILSLTPRHPEKYLKKGPAYVDGNCTYFAGKDFVDFGNVDWKSVMKKHGVTDLSRVLIFFDDHQNELKMCIFTKIEAGSREPGFKHLIFEDIYDTGTGDHYSLRQICDQSYIEIRVEQDLKRIVESCLSARKNTAWDHVHGSINYLHINPVLTYTVHWMNYCFQSLIASG